MSRSRQARWLAPLTVLGVAAVGVPVALGAGNTITLDAPSSVKRCASPCSGKHPGKKFTIKASGHATQPSTVRVFIDYRNTCSSTALGEEQAGEFFAIRKEVQKGDYHAKRSGLYFNKNNLGTRKYKICGYLTPGTFTDTPPSAKAHRKLKVKP